MFLNYFIYFIIYAFIGWIYESIFRTITHRKVINSGFLNGPLIPIYGFGAILVVFLFFDDNLSLIPLFLSSMMVTTILEYVTSYVMEKVFHARWWDYSNKPFNVNGRVFLLGAVVFGALSIIVVEYVHPNIISFVNSIDRTFIYFFSIVLFLVLIFDFIYTSVNILNLDKKIRQLDQNIKAYTKKDTVSSSDVRLYIKYKIESDSEYPNTINLLTKKHKTQIKRLIKAFPALSFISNLHIWEDFKEKFNTKDIH